MKSGNLLRSSSDNAKKQWKHYSVTKNMMEIRNETHSQLSTVEYLIIL